jgi:excisionase family DNA binding protein
VATRKTSKKGAGSMEDLMSYTQAATRRGVTRAAIADLVTRGRLRSVSVGGRPMVYRSEVDGFEKEKPGPKGARKRGR